MTTYPPSPTTDETRNLRAGDRVFLSRTWSWHAAPMHALGRRGRSTPRGFAPRYGSATWRPRNSRTVSVSRRAFHWVAQQT